LKINNPALRPGCGGLACQSLDVGRIEDIGGVFDIGNFLHRDSFIVHIKYTRRLEIIQINNPTGAAVGKCGTEFLWGRWIRGARSKEGGGRGFMKAFR